MVHRRANLFFSYIRGERKKELLSGLDFFTSLFSSFFRPSFSSFRTGILHSASRHKKCVSIDIKSCCCDNSAGQDWLIPIGRRRRRSRRKFIPYTYISIHRDTPYKGGGVQKHNPPNREKKERNAEKAIFGIAGIGVGPIFMELYASTPIIIHA